MRRNALIIIGAMALCACAEKAGEEAGAAMASPTELNAVQMDLNTVRLTWTDNAEGEAGYRVYLRGEGDPYHVPPVESIEADATEYTFSGLQTGGTYSFGVQAAASDMMNHSEITYLTGFKVLDREELGNQEGTAKVAAPSDVAAVQTEKTSVTLTWKDNADDETGYNIYMREVSEDSFGEPVTSIAADSQSYTFTGLVTGTSYVFGVQAAGESVITDSRIMTSEDLTLIDLSYVPKVAEIKASYTYIAVTYSMSKLSGSNPEHGICFSTEGAPTVNELKVAGPEIAAGTEILQVVPGVVLEDGKDYQMSVYVKKDDSYVYSTPQTVRLEAQPEMPELVWEKQDYAGAEGVEIYRTASQLNGRNFNAWYAIADPSKVDFRVMYPETVGSKKTVKAQAEAVEDCLVLINGAIFGNYNIGVIMTEGQMTQQWHGEIEGCYWGTDSKLYQVTRPVIGVDKDGKAGAYWVGVPQQGTFLYYDRPQANVVGQARYPKVSGTSPSEAVSWQPYYAISCGPMVLYDGKVTADNSMVDDTHYYTNYECWDESGVYSAHPDRTAVGVTADGRIVLFICDGRIDASQGAYMKELGPVMKSIGCVHAMNLDGGGSTGMWVKDAGMINHMDKSWRAVKSTLGFFRKK